MTQSLGAWEIDFEKAAGKDVSCRTYHCRKATSGEYNAVIKIFETSANTHSFQREVDALSKVSGCPHTLELLDYGRNPQGKLCIVTSRLEGETLEHHVKAEGPISLGNALKLLKSMLQLLEIAHRTGLVHLNINASTVMVCRGNFFLIDWGVARSVEQGHLESIHADQDFVAPERYFGSFSPATDFYSLGWLIFYSLTGRIPYHFDTIKDKGYRPLAHCLERPEVEGQVADSIAPLILNWLSKEPEERYVAYDINSVLAGARSNVADFFQYRSMEQLRYEFTALNYAAAENIPYAEFQFAEFLLVEGRQKEAIYWLERAAEHGWEKAVSKLAKFIDGDSDSERNGIRAPIDWGRWQ